MAADGSPLPDLVGGHPALDLVNTISWRLDPGRRRDHLTDGPALADWLQRVGLLDTERAEQIIVAAPEASDVALAKIHLLREQLHGLVGPFVDGHRRLDALRVAPGLKALLNDATEHSELSGSPLRWRLDPGQPQDLPRLLALQVLDLLQNARLDLLRRCQGAGCGWVFLDSSRSRTRRWCSSGDCGNRERARRHYERHRRAAAPAWSAAQ